MNKELEKVVKLANNGQDVPMDKQLIITWLDDKVKAMNRLNSLYRNSPVLLSLGKYDEETGHHQLEIEACVWEPRTQCHIFRGISALADAVGVELQTRPHCGPDDKDLYHYFNYKGIEFFQIQAEGEELR